MVKPVQITFHNLEPSEALERAIRARVADLETYHPGIIGCRVFVDVPHRHRERGRHVRVRIELSLPGDDIFVNHEPTLVPALKDVGEEAIHKEEDIEAARKHAEVAIHEAFDAARRRLQDAIRRHREYDKARHSPDRGRVVSLGADHGFIETSDGRQLYFHEKSVVGGAFSALKAGAEVAFVEVRGDKTPQASMVRLLPTPQQVP
jgi:cold shock CspA family protein/ribosome-associated translation inhibitor RaiA